MAGTTRTQQRRIISSGEQPSDRTWYNTAISNLAAGLPTDLASIAEAPEFIKSAAVGAWNAADPNVDFGDAFMKSMYGEEGVAELSQLMQARMSEYLSELPPELANDPKTQADIKAAIEGSPEWYHTANKHRMALSQWSEDRQNQIQEQYGLPPVYQQSTIDELTQMIPGLLVPTPSKVVNAGRIANRGLRWASNVVESFLPGVTGPGSAVANAAVGTALPQGVRYLGDQPNVLTGEAFTTDTGMTYDPLVPGIQELGQGEDASAPAPFAVQNNVALPLPFDFQPSVQVRPSANRDAPIVRERDPDGGGGGSKWALLAGLGAAGAVVGALVRGKLPNTVTGQIVQDVDSAQAAQRLTFTADELDKPLEGGFSTARKTVSKQSPIHQVAENALSTGRGGVADPQMQDKLNKLNREVGAASRMEIGNATTRTVLHGELPFLNRRTVPLSQLRKIRDANMDDAEKALWKRALVFLNKKDQFDIETRTVQQKLADAQNKLARARNPAALAQAQLEVRNRQRELAARNQPNAPIGTSGHTLQEMNQTIAAAQANQKVNALLTGMRRIRDDFDEVNVRGGMWTNQHVADARLKHPHFLPEQFNEFAKYGKGIKNVYERGKAAARGRGEFSETGQTDKNRMYKGQRTPLRSNMSTFDKSVDDIGDPLDALESHIFESHRQIRLHRAAQTFTEMVHGTDDWGHSIKQIHAPMSLKDYEGPGSHRQLLNRADVYSYNAGGMMHIIQAADTETARAMLHNPSSTMAGADLMRRFIQQTLTGNVLAPWFAWRGAEYELDVARTMLNKKYSKGMIDKLLKQTFPNTKLAQLGDFIPDPTVRIQQIAALAELVNGKALGKIADVLADQMMDNSTLIKALGPTRARAVAQAGIRMANDMRSRYMYLERNGILNIQNVVEHNESIFQDFAAAQRMMNSAPGKVVSGGAQLMMDAWGGFFDAVRNSAKYSIAAQNLEILRKKHGNIIPNDVAREFIRDMKYMSGDMTRAIGNKNLAKAMSAAPFGPNAVNSTLHVMDGLRKQKVYIGTRILTNMVLPKILGVYLLTKWMQNDDGTNDFTTHFFDNMPSWQRMSTVPALSPTYLLEIATGEYRKPTINDVVFMAQAPEAIPFAETVFAMAQATGLMGTHAQDKQSWKDVGMGIVSFANVNFPIVEALDIAINGSDKELSQGLSGDSETVTRVKDAFGTLFGGALDVIGASYSAGTDAWERESNIGDIMEQAFSYAKETVTQKFPETLLSPLFGGQRRHYTRTQVRDRNMSTFDKIDDISKQMSIQKSDMKAGAGRGGLARPSTEDPIATALMQTMHSYADSGVMLAFRKQRSELYNQINRYDANRGKVSADEYTRETERIKMAINDVDRQEEEVFDKLNTRLAGLYRQYGVTDVDSAIAYVKKTMHP